MKEILSNHGYEEIRCINGNWCGLMRMIFTVGVCHGMDENRVKGRFCFDTYQNASLFLKEWDGETPPVIGDDGCTAIK